MSEDDSLRLVGTVVAEKYRVDTLTAEGGFALVYKATHILWKRPVALKVFKALGDVSRAQKEELLQSFIREGALLADLSERSASICQARDVGMLVTPAGESIPFMVLEWLEGSPLDTVLEEEKAKNLPARSLHETMELLGPIGEALALAHTRGVVHRDVKPANIFLLGEPRAAACPVKLLDFGIAKVVMDAQKAGGAFATTQGATTAFTPGYAAPEQFSRSHGPTGPWTDTFSLALVVIECLTGSPALGGDDFLQIAFAATNPAQRPTPRSQGAQVSDDVEAVFVRALAVQTTARYGTVGEFWNALRVAMGEGPMSIALPARPGMLLTPPPGSIAFTPRAALEAMADVPRASAPPAPLSAAPRGSTSAPGAPAARPGSGPAIALSLLGAAFTVGLLVWGAIAVVRGVQPAPDSSPSLGSSVSATPSSSSAPSSSPSSLPVRVSAPSASAAASSAAPARCPADMVFIPAGQFFMGSDEGLPMEKPAHNVKLAPFCIGIHEVTTEQYLACSELGKCKRASAVNQWDGITAADRKTYDPLCNVVDAEKGARLQHPINCVDWERADIYCRATAGRLPTEAEWEFAARGPDGRLYPWGDEPPSAKYLNACGPECVAWGKSHRVEEKAMYATNDGWPNTAPVGSFPEGKSRFGLMDVVGNVWEWVADWYAPYTDAPAVDPRGPAKGKARVMRGGAWNGAEPSWVRPSFRYRNDPASSSYGVGFRCAADPK